MLGAPVLLFFAALLTRGREVIDFANQLFGSFVAVTGDAHQARVAQDIFRQEIRYERSLQIREDIRDVNKMMLESIQTDLFIGSILLGVCFSMFIEGYPPLDTKRVLFDLWLVFVGWASTFVLLSLWLALSFQAKISACTRERLLQKHRFQMPDEQLVGRMGGSDIVRQMAIFHDQMLKVMNEVMLPDTPAGGKKQGKGVFSAARRLLRRRRAPLQVEVRCADGRRLDCDPIRKGMRAWLQDDADSGHARHIIVDLPSFLIGETLVRQKWESVKHRHLHLRVKGEATLYFAAQCPPRSMVAKDHPWIMPSWPGSQLPVLVSGSHEAWRNDQGHGEVKRVNGFSVYLDEGRLELPLYKVVLETPADDGDGWVQVNIRWNFRSGVEGLLVMVRKGHVHCKEEDWPIQEFNNEIKQIMPIRDFSARCLRYGVWCLLAGAFLTCTARTWQVKRNMWWYENVLYFMCLLPAAVAIKLVPISMSTEQMSTKLERNTPEFHQLGTMNLENLAQTGADLGTQNDHMGDARSWKDVMSSDGDSIGEDEVGDFPEQGVVRPSGRGADAEQGTATPPAGPSYLANMGGACPGLRSCSAPEFARCREVIKVPVAPPAPKLKRMSADHVSEEDSIDGSVERGPGAFGVRSSTKSVAPPSSRFVLFCVRRLPSWLKPVGYGVPEVSTSKALRATMRRLRAVENTLRGVFVCSLISAIAMPYEWENVAASLRDVEWSSIRRLEGGCFELDIAYPPLPREGSVAARAWPLTTETDAIACQARCAAVDGCLGFSLSPTGACRLRAEAEREEAPQREPGAVSGPKLCPQRGSASAAAGAPGAGDAAGADLGAPDADAGADAASPLEWAEWKVRWPPLFRPTTAAWASGGGAPADTSCGVLWLAAGAVLRAMRQSPCGEGGLAPTFDVAGPPLLLPGVAAALLEGTPGRLTMLGDGGVHEVDIEEGLDDRQRGSVGGASLDVLSAASARIVGQPGALPLGFAGVTSAGLWRPDLASAPVAVVAAGARRRPAAAADDAAGTGATSRGGVALLGPGAAVTEGAALRVLGLLDNSNGLPENITALHVCSPSGRASAADPAPEASGPPAARLRGRGAADGVAPASACGGATGPVLWVASDGELAAVSLRTGSVVGRFLSPPCGGRPRPVPAGAGAAAAAWRRPRRRAPCQVTALTGNTTHLLAVTSSGGRRSPAILVARYPPLPADESAPGSDEASEL